MLLVVAVTTQLLLGADNAPAIVRPAAVFSDAKALCVVDGARAEKEPVRVQWLLSAENTVVARGESVATPTPGRTSLRFPLTPPTVARVTALRLDVEIADQRVSGNVSVYPATWAHDLAAAHGSGTDTVGVFDSGAFVERLERLGVRVEGCSTALGLSAFKGDVLLVSPLESAAGWNLAARLDERVQAGLTVVVFAPERLRLTGLAAPLALEPHPAALRALHGFADANELALPGLETERVLGIPRESNFTALVETVDDARRPAIAERESGKGRWVVVAFDPTVRASQEPCSLNLLWKLLDYARAHRGAKRE